MADILLTHGYFLWEDEKEQQIMKPYPTLGLLYNAAYLKRAGFDVALYDTTFGNRAELYARLADKSAPVLGLYTNLITRGSVVQIMTEAKRHGWHVVVGGPESANYPAEYLVHGADVIVIGEGEATLAELLPALRTHGPHRLHHVAGIVFRDESGELVRNPERDQIDDIDSIPWPARELIDQQQYVEVWRKHHGMGSVNLITARGCPYKCKWCSHAVFGYSHRRRNYMDCADEVQHIYETYKPDQVWYADDVFTISHRWLYDYAAELKRRNIKLPFETISRADRMMDERVLATLAEMGCYRIWIGSESGSQRILDAMQRGVTVEQVQWATKAAQKHGIEVGMFLMWGYDGEDLSDIEATIDHVKKANPNIYFTTVSYPIKNTPYYKKVEDSLALNKDWAAATDRDYVIKGRHTRAYYKHADKWLRSEVAAFRLLESDPMQASLHQQEAGSARAALLAVADEVE
ncbi:MAG: B12-binding domain-containing radical SAM protein [Anaerolineae bacterium]|nr:B12-binding domain-containing radical SAM protein [Anaerolineae bacterium]